MESQYIIYRTYSIVSHDRRERLIETLPLIGLAARPWIDMTARDWREVVIEVRTVNTSEVDETLDTTPSTEVVTPHRRVIQESPRVIFEASSPAPYSELPLAA